MKKKTPFYCAALFGLILSGCVSKTTPEIIMPDQPMSASVTDEKDTETQNKKPESRDGSEAPSDENYTVYLITMDLTDSYWKSIDDGCLEAAKELGNVTYRWTGPDSHDDALQSACIDDAVADAILIAANSADGVNDSLKKAEEAGCKIVYVDSAASYDCISALSTDNVAAGKTAGETMIHSLQEKGIQSGTIAVFGVTADTASCVAREDGFRSAFADTDFTLADTVYMQDDAANVKSAVQDGLSQNYVGFFGTNEGTTLAVGQTVKENNAQTTIVGFDTSDAVLELVSDGVIYATMQQNPKTMGHDGLLIAVGALSGTYTDTNTKTDTGVTIITKESM